MSVSLLHLSWVPAAGSSSALLPICEGLCDLTVLNCVHACLGGWGNLCSRLMADALGQYKAMRDTCKGKEAILICGRGSEKSLDH